MIKKICHVTSVHKPTDARIFERECLTLAQRFDVTLIAPNVDDSELNGIHIKGVTLPQNRIKRQRNLNFVYAKMKEIDADVYHFHDPELMPLGLKIKRHGKKIIFDSHEDIPSQIKNKKYIPTQFLRILISKYYEYYEKKSLKHYDAVVSVTPEIVHRLKKINPNTIMLTNYPIFKDGDDGRMWEKKIGFAGLISRNWNLHHVLEAIKDMDLIFELAGPCHDGYIDELKLIPGWDKVHYHGVIKHQEVFDMLKSCTLGLALETYNNPNAGWKKGSIGVTKIYEYMHEGIPVIATDLDNWVPIIEGTESGYCVNPMDPKEIRMKIEYLLNNKEEAKRLGDNGRKAVKDKYCWQTQEKILFEMYEKILVD